MYFERRAREGRTNPRRPLFLHGLFVVLSFLLSACSVTAPPHAPVPTFVPVTPPAVIVDDLPLDGLLEGLKGQISVLERDPQHLLHFGSRAVTAAEYRSALIELFTFLRGRHATSDVAEFVRNRFDFVAIDNSGLVQVTAYFEPIIAGSHSPTPEHSHALYAKPADLAVKRDRPGEILRFRRGDDGARIGSYYTRAEIDIGGALKGRSLELCYVDPLDAFILQTQGSGTIRFEDGSLLRLNFAEKNGYPYTGLGKLSEGRIPGRVRSLHDLELGLRQLPRASLLRILSGNQSYVFFRPGGSHAITAVGVPAVAGRTVATDRTIFPKGTLAFLTFGRPVFSDPDADVPSSFRATTRFVVDQDTGTAITGPKRLDLFIGQGDSAKREAGAINGSGRLLYLVPKER